MELAKRNAWEPFDILFDIQDDLNRAFGRTLTRKNGDWMTKSFQPEIEVKEEADHYTLHADLPGIKREDFTISVQGSTMTLKGERKQEKESKEKGTYYSERYYGSFIRSMDFPVELQADKVKATYKDGVLEVQLPKAESAKPKQINVEVK